MTTNLWVNIEHALAYLEERETIPHRAEDDPSNQLVGTEEHLRWLNGCGFVNVECFWKWRELAVVAGTKPVQPAV